MSRLNFYKTRQTRFERLNLRRNKMEMNRALNLLALALLVLATVFQSASAQTRTTLSRSTGMIGITSNQTARINVVRDDPFFFDDPFLRVELSFVDSDGNILAQKVYEVGAGKATFLDLNGRDVVGSGLNRLQLRAVVKFLGPVDLLPAENCIPTLEVIDNETGETRFLLPAVQKMQAPVIEETKL